MGNSKENIKELAKELCDKSGCHHKCKEIDECVVMEEAEELLINQDKSNNFDVKSNNLPFVLTNEENVSEKYFTPSEVRKMTPKEVRENYDLIIQSMEKWNMSKEKQSEPFSCGHENGGNWVQLPCKVGDTLYVISQMKDKCLRKRHQRQFMYQHQDYVVL